MYTIVSAQRVSHGKEKANLSLNPNFNSVLVSIKALWNKAQKPILKTISEQRIKALQRQSNEIG